MVVQTLLGGDRSVVVDLPPVQQREGSSTHPGSDSSRMGRFELVMLCMRDLMARGTLQMLALWNQPDSSDPPVRPDLWHWRHDLER